MIFISVCDELFYGENCSVPCGNCLKNEQCHHLNGTCFNGCMSGFMGSECIEGSNFNGVASEI